MEPSQHQPPSRRRTAASSSGRTHRPRPPRHPVRPLLLPFPRLLLPRPHRSVCCRLRRRRRARPSGSARASLGDRRGLPPRRQRGRGLRRPRRLVRLRARLVERRPGHARLVTYRVVPRRERCRRRPRIGGGGCRGRDREHHVRHRPWRRRRHRHDHLEQRARAHQPSRDLAGARTSRSRSAATATPTTRTWSAIRSTTTSRSCRSRTSSDLPTIATERDVLADDDVLVMGNALGRGGEPTVSAGRRRRPRPADHRHRRFRRQRRDAHRHDQDRSLRAARSVGRRGRERRRRGRGHDHSGVDQRRVPTRVRRELGRGVRDPDRAGAVGGRRDQGRRVERQRARRARGGARASEIQQRAVCPVAAGPAPDATGDGVAVSGIQEDGPAADAGISVGSTILAIDDIDGEQLGDDITRVDEHPASRRRGEGHLARPATASATPPRSASTRARRCSRRALGPAVAVSSSRTSPMVTGGDHEVGSGVACRCDAWWRARSWCPRSWSRPRLGPAGAEHPAAR